MPGEQHGLALELLLELVDEVDFPLEPLDLPCAECEGEDGDDADDEHEGAEEGVFLGLEVESRAVSVRSGFACGGFESAGEALGGVGTP